MFLSVPWNLQNLTELILSHFMEMECSLQMEMKKIQSFIMVLGKLSVVLIKNLLPDSVLGILMLIIKIKQY